VDVPGFRVGKHHARCPRPGRQSDLGATAGRPLPPTPADRLASIERLPTSSASGGRRSWSGHRRRLLLPSFIAKQLPLLRVDHRLLLRRAPGWSVEKAAIPLSVQAPEQPVPPCTKAHAGASLRLVWCAV
jgi:hypothetical protein